MFYSQMVKLASEICFDAHKSDVDKAGYPYVMHPFFLAFQMDDEKSVCVALLHDVIEDHGDRFSFEYLQKVGFDSDILSALKLLTHDESVPYLEYVKQIGSNEIARKVKIADLKHNLDCSRLGGKQSRKFELYTQALNYLQSVRG